MAEQKSYVKNFKEGEIIFCEYEPGSTFYLIKKGRVKITKISEKYEKTLDVLGEGSLFGEMAIIEQAPRSATAIAETN
ncbi:MAG: Crp/Fnr family transcriptional regulator, partial [Spirochaetae bacterium HGW-Spirochaetae-6]